MAKAILSGIFDQGSFTELDRLTDNCEVVTGFGSINGCPCYAFVQDAEVNGGAMGTKQASKLIKLYDLAKKRAIPLSAFMIQRADILTKDLALCRRILRLSQRPTDFRALFHRLLL